MPLEMFRRDESVELDVLDEPLLAAYPELDAPDAALRTSGAEISQLKESRA
jgi:hypothetical protein